ncbi:AbrB family transcriptional regulator [Aneurinibacillus sp. Ricciae_BoGa-3]|uniref:AbrB family transcriptional regulator n=1 Tax=Aneurinibacillus sp. Ricciae_BoGa-3 TaxID=3022697 RepID=UPI0023421A2B|nr:AbrB family transcriptional regulator [Aneurinibacillus sp. Ricciae_BoGa-3]WCK53431.1 AbrB family transcriptional regulator [Aneurinibacillus sp. Ricciae_BoGa-3]
MRKNTLWQNSSLIALSGLGGYVLSLTGVSIGWLVGTLLAASILSFWKSKWLANAGYNTAIKPHWRHVGQAILGIELGQNMNLSTLDAFQDNYIVITVMLLLSIVFALFSGLILWRFSKADMITSLFGTTPGGISAMPSMAEEVGANTIVVSIVQLIRIFLVVGTIPLLASYWHAGNAAAVPPAVMAQTNAANSGAVFHFLSFIWTVALALAASCGYFAIRKIKFPAPWLVGGMLGTAAAQMLGSSFIGENLAPWWPHQLIILAQIFIGANIGSRLNKEMFTGAARIAIVGLLSSLGLVLALVFCSVFVSKITQIPLVTCILAFAPGGVAEMATTSLALHADSGFVVAVQSLRLLTIFLILPPFYRLLHRQSAQQEVKPKPGAVK